MAGFRGSEYSIHGITQSSTTLDNGSYTGYMGSNDFELINRSTRTYSSGWTGFKERVWRKKILHKKIPIVKWLPNYTKSDALGDLIAGLTIGMMIIPQSLAYAGVSGLEPKYGLYSAFLGCFIYVILGSCKDVPFGPTATASLMTFQAAGGSWERSVLLTFLGGIIELTAGILGFGFLIDFVSGPVGSGFISAIALTVCASQLKYIFGISAKGNTFLEMIMSLFENIDKIRLGDTVLGISCIFILVSIRFLSMTKLGPSDPDKKTPLQRILNRTFWILGISRNALVVLITAILAYFLHKNGDEWFILNGSIPKGMPPIIIPPFSVPEIRDEATGEIIQEYQSFLQMIQYLGAGLVIVPLIGLLENMSICKAFAKGKPIDPTQELIAIGSANILTTFIGGYRGNGGLSRGAVMNASGVRTQFANFYTGSVVILALLFLTPYFYYIPKASLGAIIISAVSFAIEYHVILPIWKTKKSDIIPCFITFIACLVIRIDIGILIGLIVNICFILYHSARPKIYLERKLTEELHVKYIVITPDRCLMFPSCDYVRTLINKHGIQARTPVVLDCTMIFSADYTGAKTVEALLKDFEGRSQSLYFLNLKPTVVSVLEGANIMFRVFYDFKSLEDVIDNVKEKRTSL